MTFLVRGASVRDGAVRFAVWAPHADAVSVRVLSGPSTREWELVRGSDGVFATVVAEAAADVDYVYRLRRADRECERADPVSRFQPAGVHGPSRVVDPRRFRWSDGEWRGCERADLVLYELHVGTFTDAGTFDAVIPHLAGLRELGITAIELMPVAEFPGTRNWGYDGVHLYAPQSSYGGPEALRRLVDAAHRTSVAVILDVVYNHLGPEGNRLADFGPYFTDRYRTPWGAAINYDGPGSDEVRRWVVDNALYWIHEFHLDGLRLDAVHAIYDFGAQHILGELASAVHAAGVSLRRHVHVIAESDLNDPRLVRPRERGGQDLDAQWCDDFHHALHVALTGERTGYYGDFGGVGPVAKSLADRFVYDGRHSSYRHRRHGAPAADVTADRFVVFAQNHDQVGNRARGERLAALVPFARQRLAAAAFLLSPYIPMLFMGEEYGETNPFQYFVSHGDPELVAAVRAGREHEFAEFALNTGVPDPQAIETFLRSRLDRAHANAQLEALCRDCLALRRAERALRPGAADCQVYADTAAGWVALRLATPTAAALLVVHNFAEAQEVALPWVSRERWSLVLTTEAERYGGTGARAWEGETRGALGVKLPAWGTLVFREERASGCTSAGS